MSVLAPKVPCPACGKATRRVGGYCFDDRDQEPGLFRRGFKPGWLHERNVEILRGLDYSGCPERIVHEVRGYFENGWEPGLGVRGILENDLRGCFGEWRGKANELFAFQQWLYNEAPAFALGSKGQVALFLSAWKETRK